MQNIASSLKLAHGTVQHLLGYCTNSNSQQAGKIDSFVINLYQESHTSPEMLHYLKIIFSI